MAPSRKEPKLNTVLVCGDLIIDNHTYIGSREKAAWKEVVGTKVISTLGGAHLTYSLIKQLENGDKVDCWYDPELAFNAIRSEHPENHAYAEWKVDNDGTVRFKQPLGYGFVNNPMRDLDYERLHKSIQEGKDILVIDDGALGFRQNSVTAELPKGKCYILKTNQPLIDGYLWKTLTHWERIGKLITLISIHELRKFDIKISKGISWEQTCLDLCYELVSHSVLKKLIACKFLVVSMGAAGAMVVKNGSKKKSAEFALAYDPGYLEGEWEIKENVSGIGQMCAFTAGFTNDMMKMDVRDLEKTNIKDILRSTKSGTLYLREMLEVKTGWPVPSDNIPSPVDNIDQKAEPDTNLTIQAESVFSDAFIPSPYWYKQPGQYLKENLWSIFLNNYNRIIRSAESKKDFTGDIALLAAASAAKNGKDQLKHVPYLACHKLFTIDRIEIEHLRNVRKLISQYIMEATSKPFNFAVFGPSGAGKSFTVRQLAYSLYKIKDFGKHAVFITFNLSQCRDERELIGAFHRVSDTVLKGKLPFVYWEEFDCSNLKWLRYFLTPMKHGEFQAGRDIHPLGKCIFIFAGSSVPEIQYFEPANPEEFDGEETPGTDKVTRKKMKIKRRKYEEFKANKGMDFKSRLHAYMNVQGPNRKLLYDSDQDDWKKEDPADLLYPVRRALYMRTCWGIEPDEKLKMDPGLVMAFLKTSYYKHGARSLSHILKHLKSDSSGQVSRSELPSDEIMSQHVDFDEFMHIANDKRMDKFPVEDLAKVLYQKWLEKIRGQDTQSIFHHDYENLPEEMKLDHMFSAERILNMLNVLGYKAVRNKDPRPSMMVEFKIRFIKDTNELEFLAKEEHKGWTKARKRAGWRKGIIRNDYFKRDPRLVKYKDLKAGEKEEVRNTIRNMPDYFEQLNYKIVRAKRTKLNL
jgi:hypothetical protein